MRKLLLAATALIAFAAVTPAKADIVLGGETWTSTGTNLQLVASPTSGNQVQNLPCLICGATQPQQPTGFGYTDFGNTGNETNLIYFSSGIVRDTSLAADTIGTPYSAGFLINYLQSVGDLNLTFTIGIDVNDTGTPQTLESFAFLNLSTNTVLAQYSLFEPGGTLLPNINNGTGYPDYQLTGLTLDGISPGDELLFYARISGANDGPDSFYLVAVPSVAAVPELSTWAMMILGFAGVGLFGMRKRNQDGSTGFRFV